MQTFSRYFKKVIEILGLLAVIITKKKLVGGHTSTRLETFSKVMKPLIIIHL